MKPFLKRHTILLIAVLALCAAAAKPLHTVIFYTDIGGSSVKTDSALLNLQGTPYTIDGLLESAPRLQALRELQLGTIDLNADQLEQLQTAYPSTTIEYSVDILGQIVPWNTAELDLSPYTPAQVEQALDELALLPALKRINLISADGVCLWQTEDIPVLDRLRDAAPQVSLRLKFDLFGQTVCSEDTRIEYYRVKIGNEGLETIRAAMPYLESCEYLLLDGCGIDDELLAQLRDDFPETKVVWRIWLGYVDYDYARAMRAHSFLTDTHRIRTSQVNNKNCHLLRYCTEVKYVDFGHNHSISDFSFLAYMPKLEVAIIALTRCADLTPLASCPELEYLEVYRSSVTDLSPLAACTKLKHLNFGDTDVADISCLYGLELERMRACKTKVPEEQFEEYLRLHPNCQMLNEGRSPSLNGWRYDQYERIVPRYALLKEQMEYSIDAKYGLK